MQNRETAKKIDQNRKPLAKPLKPFNSSSHSSYQNPNRSRAGSKKWSVHRFRNYSRSVEVHNFRPDRGETGTQKGKYSNHIAYQISKPISTFNENGKPNAKKNQQTTKYTKTERPKVSGTKNEKLI